MKPAFRIRPRSPGVLPLPYPYRSALAISNDPDYLSFPLSDQLLRFLTGNHSSDGLRSGLGLRISTGYFAYSPDPAALALGLLKEDRLLRHPRFEEVQELGAEGLLDTLHTFGDHDSLGAPRRRLTEQAIDLIRESGMPAEVWTNHGTDRNSQCLGPSARHHRGDIPNTSSYGSDLWADLGGRYLTSSHLAISGSPTEILRERTDLGVLARARLALSTQRTQPRHLLKRGQLRDGHPVLYFARFRGPTRYAPNISTLASQVETVSSVLKEQAGYAVIIYQHFGVLKRLEGRIIPMTLDSFRQSRDVHLAFESVAKLIGTDGLWNPSLPQLLATAEVTQSASVEISSHDAPIISISNVPDSPWGYRGLEGFSVKLSKPCKEASFLFRGVRIPALIHSIPGQKGPVASLRFG